jgi:muramidase (phage lysozyme)
MYEEYLSNPNVRAFLDVLAYCEGADYNTIFGGGAFSDFSQHPNITVRAGGYNSNAAGRYQFLYSTWRGLGLADFSPANQDLGAVMLIAQKGALQSIANGDLQSTVAAVRSVWPSLPGGRQQTRSWADVTNYFQNDLAAQGASPQWTDPNGGYDDGGGRSNSYESILPQPTSGIGIAGVAAAIAGVLVLSLIVDW